MTRIADYILYTILFEAIFMFTAVMAGMYIALDSHTVLRAMVLVSTFYLPFAIFIAHLFLSGMRGEN